MKRRTPIFLLITLVLLGAGLYFAGPLIPLPYFAVTVTHSPRNYPNSPLLEKDKFRLVLKAENIGQCYQLFKVCSEKSTFTVMRKWTMQKFSPEDPNFDAPWVTKYHYSKISLSPEALAELRELLNKLDIYDLPYAYIHEHIRDGKQQNLYLSAHRRTGLKIVRCSNYFPSEFVELEEFFERWIRETYRDRIRKADWKMSKEDFQDIAEELVQTLL